MLATLTGTATYEIEADVLTLQTGSDGLVLRAAGDSDAAAELEGVTWTLDSTSHTGNDAITVTAVPALERPATLMFDAGEVSVDTSCNIGGGGYEVVGERDHVRSASPPRWSSAKARRARRAIRAERAHRDGHATRSRTTSSR